MENHIVMTIICENPQLRQTQEKAVQPYSFLASILDLR